MPLPYPKRYPKYNHLGKNIEIVIDKALKEEDPEKRQGFANAIAYYMKLTYSNWHKELVHDDNIQTELAAITKGELEFNNRPFVKHRVDNRGDRDDYEVEAASIVKISAQEITTVTATREDRDNRNNNNRNNIQFKKKILKQILTDQLISMPRQINICQGFYFFDFILHHNIIYHMSSFEVRGGKKLNGEITPQGAKNEALQIISAVLLTAEKVTINNIPDIIDVNLLIELLEDLV